MACNITTGRQLPCKDATGGIQAVYFLNYNQVGFAPTSSADDVITGLGSVTAYKYAVKGANNNLQNNINSSRDNGTTFFEQVVNVQLTKLDATSSKELKLLAYGRPQIVVHTYEGDAFVCGINNGMELTAGSLQTGTAMGDLYGYTATFTGQEQLYSQFISGSTVSNPFAGITGVSVNTGSAW
jgi:hypothetical protein